MNSLEPIEEIVKTYRRHGWQLRRALLRPETCALIAGSGKLFANTRIQDAAFDALWFSRLSPEGREAWELRLVAETQYALFEAFEPDETEEQRDEVRQEMENKMREHLTP
jgi:hypothetical protein